MAGEETTGLDSLIGAPASPVATPTPDPAPQTTEDTPAWKADVDAASATSASQVETLKREIGRLQSMTAKTQQGDQGADDYAALKNQYDSLDTLLGVVVDGMDETALPADVRARVLAAQQESRNAAQWAERKAEILAEVAPKVEPKPVAQQPNTDAAARAAAGALQKRVEDEIRGYGLDPRNAEQFDWKHASTVYTSQGLEAMMGYFRTQIRTHVGAGAAAEQQTTRLEQRRVAAGAGAPDAAGGTQARHDVVGDTSRSFEDRHAALQAEIGRPI